MSTIQWRPDSNPVQPTQGRTSSAKAPETSPSVPQDQVSLQPAGQPETQTAPAGSQSTARSVPKEAARPIETAPFQSQRVNVPTTLQMEDVPAPCAPSETPHPGEWANVSRQTFFNPLSSIPAENLGPLGDFLELPPGTDLQGRKPAILQWAQVRKEFVASYAQAVAEKMPDGSPRDVVQALRALEEQWLQPESGATPEMRTMLMEGFKAKGSFADVARVYEKSLKQDADFKKYDIPREYYIVALNKTKQTLRSIEESQSFVQERLTEKHLTTQTGNQTERYQAYRDSGLNGEILAGLGRAFKDIHTAAQKEVARHIDQSGLSQLMQDLSGTSRQAWSVFGGQPVGEQARASAAKSVNDSLTALLKKNECGAELVASLEAQSGLKADQWSVQPGQVESLLRNAPAEERLELAASLVGRPLDQWAVQDQKLSEVSQQTIRPFVEKFLAGGTSASEVLGELSAVTGANLKAAIPQAVLARKLEDLKVELSQCGGLDPAMTAILSKTTGSAVGKDLLAASRAAMEVSRDYYQDGFAIDFEYYPGVNAVYNNLFLGNNLEAERLAPMVLRSCEREGGRTTKDYWNLATQVELGLIMNNPASLLKSLPRALENAKAGWELSTTADSIEKLSHMRKMDHADTSLLDYVGAKLRERIAVGFPPQDPDWNGAEFLGTIRQELEAMPGVNATTAEPMDPQRAEITDKLLSKSTQFTEVFNSKFVGGNVPFGGQIADVPINRIDLQALRHVISELGLNQTSDYAVFAERVDQYVEDRYGLVDRMTGKRVLEDLHSDEHHVMDRFSDERHKFTEARTSGASKTNLSMELTLGTGDCRHTAISKQALFDVWKRDHQTEHLKQALEAAESGDASRYEEQMAHVKEWDKLQLVTFTMTFHTPIDLHKDDEGKPKKYCLMLDMEGRPIKTPDGKPLPAEDHTFNALLRFDDNGLVLPFEEGGLVTQDVFYKDFYPLANRPLDPRQILDEQGFDMGKVGVATAEGEMLPLRGVATVFSGNSPKPIAGECGQTTFGGLATSFNTAAHLMEDRANTRHLVEMVSGG